MKSIIYFAMFIYLIGFVSAADFTYVINQTSLPFNKTEPVTIRYVENRTLNLTFGNYTSGNLTYLNFIGGNTTDFDINLFIPNGTASANYSTGVSLFNAEDNFTSAITFDFIIITDTINLTINQTNQTNTTNVTQNITPTVEYVLLDYNSYEYTVCTYQFPWNRTKLVTLRERNGMNVYSDYDTNFFTVPTRTVIPEVNYSIINISMHLANLSVGTYEKNVSFSIISNSSYVNFRFVIENCVKPPPTYDEMITVCSIVDKTPAEQLQCLKLQAEYQQKLYDAMLDASEKKIINQTVKEYVNITERVPVLDLGDPEVVKALKDIPITWKQMQTDQNQKDLKITELSTEVTSLRSSFTDEIKKLRDDSERRIAEGLSTLAKDNADKQATIDMYKEDYLKKATLWAWFGFGVFIALCIGGYIYWNENNFW